VTVAALVLAAGAGARFAGPGHKLDAVLAGRTLLQWSIDHALAAGVGPVLVVTPAAGTYALAPEVIEIVNDDWAAGQSTSLQAGVRVAIDLAAGAIVVGLGDQPGVTGAAWRAVAAVDAPVVIATYGGRRGHPVRLRADTWALLPTTGDEGARALLRERPDLVTELPCQGSPSDIDTVEDLRRWQNNSSTSSP